MAVQISGNDITVPRDGSFTRNVTIGGTLTYEDVTNIDSVGLVTARTGIEIGARPGVAASISVDGNMIVSGISTFGGALSGTTGTFSGAVAGTTGTFSSEITGTRANVLASSAPQIRINNDTGDGSGTRVMLGKATADNNFVSGAASGDTVLSVPGKFMHGVGTSAKVTVESAGNVNVASNLKVAGVCTATSFSGSGANLTGISAISVIDSWRMTQSTGTGDNQTIENWASATNLLNSNLGSALSYSSGTFSFPSTGHYLMTFNCRIKCGSGNDGEMNVILKVTENNSSYSDAAVTSYGAGEGNTRSAGTITYAFDITDTSNQKFYFITDSFGSSSQLLGNSTSNETYFQMIRLADT